MKNLFFTQFSQILVVLSLTGCGKDDAPAPVDQLVMPTQAGFQMLRNQALSDLVQTQKFDAGEGVHFVSRKGTIVDIGQYELVDQLGNSIIGEVELTFIEIFDRGNMAVSNKPLMGRSNNGYLLPLVTGGQFFMQVTQGDQLVKPLNHYYVTVDAAHTGGLDMGMTLWQGEIDGAGNLAWNPVEIGLGSGEGDDGNGNPVWTDGDQAGLGFNPVTDTYDFFINEFGWTNVDRFTANSGPLTKIKVTVPAPYNETNAAVYLAYQDQPGLLAQLDLYNTNDQYFTEHFGFVPIGMTLHVIFASESNGQYVYSIKEVTIEEDHVINIEMTELERIGKDDLVDKINGLN